MNGWQFRDWLRTQPRFANVPVVVLSAVRNLPAEAKKLDAAGYLEKPVTFPALLATVEKHCGPCQVAATLSSISHFPAFTSSSG